MQPETNSTQNFTISEPFATPTNESSTTNQTSLVVEQSSLDQNITKVDQNSNTTETQSSNPPIIDYLQEITGYQRDENFEKLSQSQKEKAKIRVQIAQINQNGGVDIRFQPPSVVVPHDWDYLWSDEYLKSGNQEEIDQKTESLKDILHVTFIKNSEELPQRYLFSNLTTFTNEGMFIKLNFSDPLLVSQGIIPDQVRVKMLKSYFTTPSYNYYSQFTPQNQGRALKSEDRKMQEILTSLNEDDLYLIYTESIPKQAPSQEEFEQLQKVAQATVAVAQSQFLLSFVLNFLLSGVLSLLWNIFNTMQIITALPLLAVNLPANIEQVYEVIVGVANFEVVDKKTIYKDYAVDMLGFEDPNLELNSEEIDKDENSSDQSKEFVQSSGLDKAFRGTNLALNVFLLIILALGLTLVIILVRMVRNILVTRCAQPIVKAVKFIEGRLMFNSLLRALLESYLNLSISVCYSIGVLFRDFGSNWVEFTLTLLLVVHVVGFPIFTTLFLKNHFDNLGLQQYKLRVGSLYQNQDYHKKRAVYFTTLFLLRRLIFAAVICFLFQSVVLQIAIVDTLSMILVAFLITTLPMIDTVNNFIQIFNEVFLMVCIQGMFIFSDYVPYPHVSHQLGYLFIYFVAFNILVNFAILFVIVGLKVRNAIRSAYKKQRNLKSLKTKVTDLEKAKFSIECGDSSDLEMTAQKDKNFDTKTGLLDQPANLKEELDPHSRDINILQKPLPLRRKHIKVSQGQNSSKSNSSSSSSSSGSSSSSSNSSSLNSKDSSIEQSSSHNSSMISGKNSKQKRKLDAKEALDIVLGIYSPNKNKPRQPIYQVQAKYPKHISRRSQNYLQEESGKNDDIQLEFEQKITHHQHHPSTLVDSFQKKNLFALVNKQSDNHPNSVRGEHINQVYGLKERGRLQQEQRRKQINNFDHDLYQCAGQNMNQQFDSKRKSAGVSTLISQLEWKSMQRKNQEIQDFSTKDFSGINDEKVKVIGQETEKTNLRELLKENLNDKSDIKASESLDKRIYRKSQFKSKRFTLEQDCENLESLKNRIRPQVYDQTSSSQSDLTQTLKKNALPQSSTNNQMKVVQKEKFSDFEILFGKKAEILQKDSKQVLKNEPEMISASSESSLKTSCIESQSSNSSSESSETSKDDSSQDVSQSSSSKSSQNISKK